MNDQPAPTSRPRRRKLAIALFGLAVVGLTAGSLAPLVMPTRTEAASTPDEVEHVARMSQLDIGQIAINLRPVGRAGSGPRHLIIDTVLTYDEALLLPEGETGSGGHGGDDKESGALIDQKPHIRDAFIEYLANLSEEDVTGSSGMVRMRGELLRRARSVVGSDAPQALLIQDYILQ